MNANDHVPMTNIMPFGFCKKGMPCMPLTPVAWVDVNKKHIIDGAPALTEDSKLACAHGGVITIVPLDAGSAEEGTINEIMESAVEKIGLALGMAGAIAAGIEATSPKGLMKMIAKKGIEKDIKDGKNKGKESGGDETKKAEISTSSWLDNAKLPQDYLGQALKRQNLDKAPKNFKEKWSEGGFDFEVRIHPAETQYGKQGSIYRVARRQQGVDENGQGFGWEYMDRSGGWHRTSTLKPQNPGYNDQAARDTHIQLP